MPGLTSFWPASSGSGLRASLGSPALKTLVGRLLPSIPRPALDRAVCDLFDLQEELAEMLVVPPKVLASVAAQDRLTFTACSSKKLRAWLFRI